MDFVDRHSIVRKIWGDPDLVLLIFAGSAAEFALNRAVDWLFFTGEIPRDPIGRLFSTVRYAQQIVFVDEEKARLTLDRINAQHASVEHDRGQTIPDWAYRDVLYMLIDYSERAHTLLYGPLTQGQKNDLFEVFRRVGEGLHVSELPETYSDWQLDRHALGGRRGDDASCRVDQPQGHLRAPGEAELRRARAAGGAVEGVPRAHIHALPGLSQAFRSVAISFASRGAGFTGTRRSAPAAPSQLKQTHVWSGANVRHYRQQ